jgi:galactokinase
METTEALDWDRVEQLRSSIEEHKFAESVEIALGERLLHFVREDFRTIESVDAFRQSDQRRIGKLAEDSQSDAEVFLGNQVGETIALAASARKLGALAARSFGAGFGGSVWALVDAHRAEEFARQWSPQAFVAMPGPPLMELSQGG